MESRNLPALNTSIRAPRHSWSPEGIKQIVTKLYGINAAEISFLEGYDDLNFKLSKCSFSKQTKNDQQASAFSVDQCFVLKLTNKWEAKFYPRLCDAQNDLVALLATNGVHCPQLIQQIDGSRHSLLQQQNKANDSNHQQKGASIPVRLFTFIAQPTLAQWFRTNRSILSVQPHLEEIIISVGRLLGQFHSICDGHSFCPPVFREFSPLFSLESWDWLRSEFVLQGLEMPEVMDDRRIKLCESVFDQFEETIMSRKTEFQLGLIHSDFNESNIFVSPDNGLPHKLCLIDFADSHFSFRAADVANAVYYLYFLVREHSSDVNANNWELVYRMAIILYKGYTSTDCVLPQLDLSQLGLFLRARLVVSLVYGLRALRLERNRTQLEYVLKSQQLGWTLLGEFSSGEFRDDFLLGDQKGKKQKEVIVEKTTECC